MSGETPRSYPLAPGEDDPRFTMGLLYDIAQVLEQYGYPPVRAGLDLVDLQQAVFSFIYGVGTAR